jgi:hypothetical protein
METVRMEWDGNDMLCHAGDLLIAKCHDGAWISLAPGWTVKTNASCSKVFVTHNGTRMKYGVPKRHQKNLMIITMEEPTVGPDGEPLWQPNGERQCYAKRLAREIAPDRMFVAACQVLFNRKLKAGEIGPNDCISPQEEAANVIAWCDLRQLRLLRKIAQSLIVEREYVQ